jgi:hypothetical protein
MLKNSLQRIKTILNWKLEVITTVVLAVQAVILALQCWVA